MHSAVQKRPKHLALLSDIFCTTGKRGGKDFFVFLRASKLSDFCVWALGVVGIGEDGDDDVPYWSHFIATHMY